MRLAFLFLTSSNHNQGALWETFFGNVPEDRYSLACHPKFADQVTQPFLRDNIIPKRTFTEHGNIGIVRATLLLLRYAFKDPRNECFILLSDSCIPLYGFGQVYQLLDKAGKSFISYQTGKGKEDIATRWGQLKDPGFLELERFAKQDQWMVLRRDLVQCVLQHDYTSVFERMYAPDEHYFINLLLKFYPSLDERIVNRAVTYVNWKEFETETVTKHNAEWGTYQLRRIRPKTYHQLQTTDIVAARSKGCFFFRKISPSCDCSRLIRLIRAMNSI
jgi:hypothetical protein